ncbi:hypothetical protein NM688_g2424 [Phlebia brevispora]|uniref:Uncharacterized protein n=1 Tax=Phlebia brevispora TaxID=194682 RepID=A0ACC1T903_9APHY|nr:hypothetical protein NM688_g2424 [Phlebia brevispora]
MAPSAPIIIEEGDGHHHHNQYYADGYEYEPEYPSRIYPSRYRFSDWCCPCFPSYNGFRMHGIRRYRCASMTAFFILFFAFILYLLPALSLPIIKAIYLFQLNFTAANQPPTSIATNFRFGVWGFCASSVLDEPTVFTNDGECTTPQLGYTIPPDILALSGYPTDVTDVVVKGLTVLLVLHPTVAGLSFLTLLMACFVRSQCMTILALITGLLTAVVGSIVLAADLAIELVAGHRLKQEFGSLLQVTFGNATWMILAAVACSWIGLIFLSAIACYCCGIRRKYGWYGDGYYA